MAQTTFNVLVRFRAGATADAARAATTPLFRFIESYNGAISPGDTPGEVTIRVQLQADHSLAAASGAPALIQGAYEQAGQRPAPLVPVSVEVHPVS